MKPRIRPSAAVGCTRRVAHVQLQWPAHVAHCLTRQAGPAAAAPPSGGGGGGAAAHAGPYPGGGGRGGLAAGGGGLRLHVDCEVQQVLQASVLLLQPAIVRHQRCLVCQQHLQLLAHAVAQSRVQELIGAQPQVFPVQLLAALPQRLDLLAEGLEQRQVAAAGPGPHPCLLQLLCPVQDPRGWTAAAAEQPGGAHHHAAVTGLGSSRTGGGSAGSCLLHHSRRQGGVAGGGQGRAAGGSAG
ncbi:hypothetical protein V8C86DRAFT_2586374, partial [Haematococcus lacustris]